MRAAGIRFCRPCQIRHSQFADYGDCAEHEFVADSGVYGFGAADLQQIFVENHSKGSVPNCPPFIKDKFWFYQENRNLSQQLIIEVMSRINKWIDTGISIELMYNLNRNIKARDIYDTIMDAWKKALKLCIIPARFRKTARPPKKKNVSAVRDRLGELNNAAQKLFNVDGDDTLINRRMIKGNVTNLFNLNNVKYQWANKLYRLMMENFWIPEKVSLFDDKRAYNELTPAEQNAYDGILSFLVFWIQSRPTICRTSAIISRRRKLI